MLLLFDVSRFTDVNNIFLCSEFVLLLLLLLLFVLFIRLIYDSLVTFKLLFILFISNNVFVENNEVKVEEDNILNILDNNKVFEGEKAIPIEDNVELEELPDVFWVTQTDTDDSSDSSENALSFDEQINVLLASDSKVAA